MPRKRLRCPSAPTYSNVPESMSNRVAIDAGRQARGHRRDRDPHSVHLVDLHRSPIADFWIIPHHDVQSTAWNATDLRVGASRGGVQILRCRTRPAATASLRAALRRELLKSPRPNSTAPVASGSSKCCFRFREGSKRRPPSSSPNCGTLPHASQNRKASSIRSRVRSNFDQIGRRRNLVDRSQHG